MHQVLKSYLKRLTNLTANNRSLLLLRLAADQFMDLYDFNFIKKGGSFNIIQDIIAAKRTTICPIVDSRDEDANVLSRRLKRLERLDRFIYDERGSKDLYVGWPFVRGKFTDGTLVRCPLLFFPVTLEQGKTDWELKPRTDAGISFNKTFLLAYSHFNKINIADDFIERNFEEFDTDSTVFRTGLYQELKDSAIEVNFNQDNFRDELFKFETYKKADFEEQEKTGELKMYPQAVLGIFPQAGSYLVPDYNHLIENNLIKDIEEFFAQRSPSDEHNPEHNFIRSVEEEKTFTPFKMDGYQENAIKAVKKGNSIVVQGPPGTGKSQLICNLISDHIAVGKTVLVVCQKRAALDVVYDRMHEKEMDDFLGLVHDFRNDRKDIYTKIAKQINRLEEYKMKNNGLDTIQLERKFLQTSRRIDQIAEEMEDFKRALYDESECGVSVKELYLTSDIEKPTINLKQDYTQFKLDNLSSFTNKFKSYVRYAEKFNLLGYPWRNRKPFKDYGITDQQRINEILDEIPQYQKKIGDEVEKLLSDRLTLEDCEVLLTKRDYVIEMLGILKKTHAYRYFQNMMTYSDSDTSSLWLSNTERVLMECYKGVGPEMSLPSDQLGKFQEVLQRNMDARKSLIRFIHWRVFSKDKYFIKRVLVENNLKRNKDGFNTMVEKIDNRLNLEHNLTKIKQQNWLIDIPESYEKVHFQNWFHVQKLTVKAKLIFNSLRNFKEYFNIQKLEYKEFRDKVEQLFEIIRGIPAQKVYWQSYLTDSQINHIAANTGDIEKWKGTLRRDFDALCEYDKLRDDLMSYEMEVIDKIIDELGAPTPEEAETIFQNSLRIAWIEHIETKYPELRSVSSLKLQKLEAELQNCVREKLMISNDMLLLRARERIYENVEYNRLNNMVTYRDLQHQVTKKKRIWPLRKLIDQHYDELFNLVPCWLASPESVSAIFPMKEMFDIVIFDEASQCFTERGIPAMYRGRQVVIAGDHKQLRPSDLYQVRFDDESEVEDTLLEVDSILELADKYLMNVQLRGHYRSKSLDLIDFSNKHFYDGKLKLLPDYLLVNDGVPGIEYVKVDGTWENNINREEADRVVEILVNILREDPGKQVGVVTFNARQQQLIMDELENVCLAENLSAPTDWFIKNIENVQGDEKDIIIFSTAYAPDSNGRMVMQFGSLNMAHGENRLNVAITRAREKIIMVSSIMPQQLKVEDTKNEGPKLLKEYLQYAWEVSNGNFRPSPPAQVKHNTSWYLKKKLEKWANERFKGYKFNEDLPFADITVKNNGEYVGLIITDDDLYYQSISVKDMHVYTLFTLSKKNWKFKGVYSREYWMNRDQVEERIMRFLGQMEQG